MKQKNSMVRLVRSAGGMLRHTERLNRKQRPNLCTQQSMTASQLYDRIGIRSGPALFIGSQSRALPILKQMVFRSDVPFVLVGSSADLKNSPLYQLEVDWEETGCAHSLPPGNGRMVLSPSMGSLLALKTALPQWDHFLILCLGRGLQLDCELLNMLNGRTAYALLTEALPRCILNTENSKLTPRDIMVSMDYLFSSAAGTALQDLEAVLPHYEQAAFTPAWDVTLNRDERYIEFSDGHRDNGLGARLGSSYSLSNRSLLCQDEILRAQEECMTLCADLRHSKIWLCRII